MNMTLKKRANRFLKEKKILKVRRRWVSMLGLLVLLVTAYTLILPALTVTYTCGIEGHVHGDACYEGSLMYGLENCDVIQHMGHSDRADEIAVVIHRHNQYCYNEAQKLICPITAGVTAHQHDESCYTLTENWICTAEEHTHDASCYDASERELICEQKDHTHDDDCYNWQDVVTCGKEVHEHGDSCYDTVTERICGRVEHQHSDGCSKTETVTVCTKSVHTHDTNCWLKTEKSTRDCGKSEHHHQAGCYTEERICGMDEDEEHSHSDACYKKSLICGQEEHSHSDACNKVETVEVFNCSQEEHQHSDACTETRTIPCGTEVHIHTAECERELRGELTCTTEAHQHDDNCMTKERGALNCSETEHQHSDICYAEKALNCTAEVHQHDENCKTESYVLTCEIEEVIEHDHEKACYDEHTGELICTQIWIPKHNHTEDCRTEHALVCTQEEHIHTDKCQRTELDDVHLDTDKATDDENDDNVIEENPTEPEGEADGGDIIDGENLSESEGEIESEDEIIEGLLSEDEEEESDDLISEGEPTDEEIESDEVISEEEDMLFTEEIPSGDELEEELLDEEATSSEAEELEDEVEQPSHVTTEACFSEDAETGMHVLTCEVCLGDLEAMRPILEQFGVNDFVLEQMFAPVHACGIATMDHVHTEECGEFVGYACLVKELAAMYGIEILPLDNNYGRSTLTHDFAGNITSVEVWRTEGSTTTKLDSPNYAVKEGDKLTFRLNYKLPGNTLNNNTDKPVNTITYTLPNGLPNNITASGDFTDNGMKGRYSIANGQITITFDENYVDKNQEGNAITGYVDFDCMVEQLVDSDNDHKVNLQFNQSTSINIVVRTEDDLNNSLEVNKTYSNVDPVNGTVQYTVTVESPKGTTDPVTITDIMSFSGVVNGVSGIAITNTNGKQPESIAITEHGFEAKLPAMQAGEVYTFTYTAKLNTAMTGSSEEQNTFKADTNDSGKFPIHQEVMVKPEFPTADSVVKKTGVIKEVEVDVTVGEGDEATTEKKTQKQIEWTVTVNQGHHNLNGWTLSDKLNNADYTGTVNVDPAINGQSTINLPFTFGDTTETYTLTYTTVLTDADVNQNITNVANMKPSNGTHPGYSSSASQWTGQGGQNPGQGGENQPSETPQMTKSANGLNESEDKNSGTTNWQIQIFASEEKPLVPDAFHKSDEAQTGYWELKDELQNTEVQWFTANQLKAIYAQLQNTNIGAFEMVTGNLNWEGGQVDVSQLSDSGRYTGFLVRGYGQVESTVTLDVQATVDLSEIQNITQFQNTATLNNNYWNSPTVEYRPDASKLPDPTLEKVDANNEGGGANTEHKYEEVVQNGLKWKLKIKSPAGYNKGDLTVVEHLPAGLTLDSLIFNAQDLWNQNITATQDHTLTLYRNGTSTNYTISHTASGQDHSITIPGELVSALNGSEITLTVTARFNESEVTWDKMQASFANSAELKNAEGGTISTPPTQTQTVSKRQNVVDKSAEINANDQFVLQNEGNRIPFTVVVNPDALSLNDPYGTITLKDELKFEGSGNYRMELVKGSVHVYHRNADGSQGAELDQGEYTCTTTMTNTSRGLVFTLPDKQALIVQYTYAVQILDNTPGVQVQINVHNAVSATNQGQQDMGNDEVHWGGNVQHSSAGATVKGVTLYKVDENNHMVYLPGATFTLERYYVTSYNDNTRVGEWQAEKTETTGALGIIINDYEWKKDVLYRLTETKAPEGYALDSKPFYFYITTNPYDTGWGVGNITHRPESLYEDGKPLDISCVQEGVTLYRTNRRSSVKATVNKVWQTSNGNALSAPSNASVEMELHQVVTRKVQMNEWENPNPPNRQDRVYATDGTFTLNNGNNWTKTFGELPLSGEESGIQMLYSYYFTETGVSNGSESVGDYEVSWSMTGGTSTEGASSPEFDSNAKGEITVSCTNKAKQQTIVLPETGGRGTQTIYRVGMSLMALATLGYILHLRAQRRRGGRRGA